MNQGCFYFLKDQYFIDFPDKSLMKNKETVNGVAHDRPCFYSFYSSETGIYWLIPFSSRLEKYKELYNQKMTKYGKCDTILFGEVLGHEKAFLIQNICPVIPKYISSEYLDSVAKIPVKIDFKLEKEITKKAKKVLALVRKGRNFMVFPDILSIEKGLLVMLEEE